MGRRGVTFEDVANAAEEVLASGANPTVARIRTELGDTGSNYTISRYFSEWKMSRLTQDLKARKKEGLPQPLHQLVDNLWEKLLAESLAKNEALQEESRLTIKRSFDEKEALSLELENKKTALEKLSLENNHLQANFKLSQNELSDARKQKAVLEERLKITEEQLLKVEAQSKKSLSEIERIHERHISDLKNQLQTALQHLDEYKTLIEKQRHEYIVQLDQSRTAKEKAENQLIKLQSELKQKTNVLEEKNEQLRASMVDLKVLQQQSSELERKYQNIAKEQIRVLAEFKAKHELLASKDELIQELKGRLVHVTRVGVKNKEYKE